MKKQTNTQEIMSYGKRGKDTFDDIEAKLKDLVNQTAEVLYNGRRARDFKTTCTQNAVNFGSACSDNMIEMSEVIRSASSYISTNLGGEEVKLEPPEVVITMPDIKVDDTIETADSDVLTGLQSACNSIFADITGLYEKNLTDFTQLGVDEFWVGPEYDSAWSEVDSLTQLMKGKIDESREIMDSAITKQLADLGM